MKKQDRQKVFDKYGGRCAYCGCELQKGWHVDHADSVHRVHKLIGPYFDKETGKEINDDNFNEADWNAGKYEHLGHKRVFDKLLHPDNDCLKNMMPSCPSCNLYKSSADIETFRMVLTNTVRGINKNSVQYKFAKRYGLVIETNKSVVFYFETLQ